MAEEFKRRMHLYIIQTIYEAVCNPEGWSDVVGEIRKITGATSAFFMGIGPGAEQNASVVSKHVDRNLLIRADFVDIVHTVTASLGQGGTVALDIKRNGSTWQAYLADMFDCEGQLVIAIITKEGQRRFILGLIFSYEDQADVRLANELLMALTPHLQIAMGIHRQMLKDREKAERLDHFFSQSATPRVIVSDDFRIIESNRAFERLIEKNGSFLKRSEGFLTVASSALRQEIDRLLARSQQHAETGHANIAWVKEAEGGFGWLLKVDPLGSKSLNVTPFANLGFGNDAKSMLSFCKMGDRNGLTPAVVGSVLGLTTAEASLACELAQGNAPAEIAHARGVAKNTVHNQLTSIMARHGFHRQGQLLSFLSTLSLFIG